MAASIRKELGILPRKRTEKDFSLWFEMTKQHRLPEYLPHDWLVRSEEGCLLTNSKSPAQGF